MVGETELLFPRRRRIVTRVARTSSCLFPERSRTWVFSARQQTRDLSRSVTLPVDSDSIVALSIHRSHTSMNSHYPPGKASACSHTPSSRALRPEEKTLLSRAHIPWV